MNAPGKLHSPTIDNARRQARIQSNRTGISLNQALDAQAVSMGFRHWHEAISVAQRNPGDTRLMAQIDLGSFLEFKADFVRRLFEPQRESAERLNRLWERQNLPKNQDVLQSRGFLTAEQAQEWMDGHEERHPGAGKSLANRWSSISIFSSQDVPGKKDLHFFADTSFLQWGDELGRVVIGNRTFIGGNFTTPSFAAPRPGLEDGVVRNLKDLELVYFKDSTPIESIDELAMMAMKGGDLDDADRVAISRTAQDIDTLFASSAKLGTEIASRVEYLTLQSELERIERDIAVGRDTPGGDARLKEIDRLMDASPWTLHPDRGCVRKEGAKQLESPPNSRRHQGLSDKGDDLLFKGFIRLQKEYQPAEEDEMPDSPPGEPAAYMMGSTAVFSPSDAGKSLIEQELRDGGRESDGPDDEQTAERLRM